MTTACAVTSAAAQAGRVRVATLNARGTRGDWPARRAVLAAGFAAMAPDLVTPVASPGLAGPPP